MAEWIAADPADRFVLRGDCGEFGIGLPTDPCRAAADWALWLGPDEWLLLAPKGQGPATKAQLDQAAEGRPYALVDVSHRQLGFVLRGEAAETLLAGAVPLDLSEAAFPPGMCTRTLFEKAGIVLWRRGRDAWRVEVDRSFVPYVCDLIASIAKADGLPLTLEPART